MSPPRSSCRWALLLALLGACCLLRPSNAQLGLNIKNQNSFQCWTTVNIAGNLIQTFSAANADACAVKCLATSGCTAFTLTTSNQCQLKAQPFESLNGNTGRDTSVKSSCLLKTVGGVLPSPAAVLCYPGQDVAGVELSRMQGVASPAACASLCITTNGCSFSVFRAGGASGTDAVSLCQLKGNPFQGNENAAVTRRDTGVTGICFRALNAPSVNDPLMTAAGAVPFVIITRASLKCLRAATSPYSVGQAPVFMGDCSGAEALWTYDTTTKVLTHYMSGLCLAPVDGGSGALVTLTSSCAPSASNQVMSRSTGSLVMLSGARYLQPAGQTAYEGAMMVASSLVPQEQYNFLPAPGQAFQCFSGVNVAGDLAATVSNVANSMACATLCFRNPTCTFYTFQATNAFSVGTCNLKYNAFNGNGVPTGATRAPQIAAACFNKAKSGSLPSPANYLCYGNQQVAGTIFRTSVVANPQACIDSCTATAGCTFSYFDSASQCTLGANAFFGNQGNDMNRLNTDIMSMCLRATGAPDTIASKGYVCYDKVSIAGSLVGAVVQVQSNELCVRKCEAMSDLCTFSVYNPYTQLCTLNSDAFVGGESVVDYSKVSCLRTTSGGNMNSPGNYLCYASQSLAGTVVYSSNGVADTIACAQLCTANPQCKFTMYLPIGGGTCIQKKDPFFGTELSSMNKMDTLVSSMCLAAYGAPLVLSGFGTPDLPHK